MARRPHRLFRRDERGVAALEFALFAPFLSLLLLGGIDVGRFVLARTNVDKVAFSVADVTSQYKELGAQAMSQVFRVTGVGIGDYVSGKNGVTILTSLTLESNAPKVRWQCYSTSGGVWKSKVGTEGQRGNVNAALLADANDNLIVAEVYYNYKPLFFRFFTSDQEIYATSIYRPRLGSLTTKPCS